MIAGLILLGFLIGFAIGMFNRSTAIECLVAGLVVAAFEAFVVAVNR